MLQADVDRAGFQSRIPCDIEKAVKGGRTHARTLPRTTLEGILLTSEAREPSAPPRASSFMMEVWGMFAFGMEMVHGSSTPALALSQDGLPVALTSFRRFFRTSKSPIIDMSHVLGAPKVSLSLQIPDVGGHRRQHGQSSRHLLQSRTVRSFLCVSRLQLALRPLDTTRDLPSRASLRVYLVSCTTLTERRRAHGF